MSKGYYSLPIIIIMLISTIHKLCLQENNFSRRDVLVQTLKNAEKQARYEERQFFLCECRRSQLYPNFILSLTNPTERVYRPTATLTRRLNGHRKELLNEAIQDTSRTLAFLHREQRRLSMARSDQKHPLNTWTEEMAHKIYAARREELRVHLRFKLSKLSDKMKSQNAHTNNSFYCDGAEEPRRHSTASPDPDDSEPEEPRRHPTASPDPEESEPEVWYDAETSPATRLLTESLLSSR